MRRDTDYAMRCDTGLNNDATKYRIPMHFLFRVSCVEVLFALYYVYMVTDLLWPWLSLQRNEICSGLYAKAIFIRSKALKVRASNSLHY